MIPPSLFLWAYGGYLIAFVNDINLDRSAWIILDLIPDRVRDRVVIHKRFLLNILV